MHARMLSVVVFSAERLQAAATAAGGSDGCRRIQQNSAQPSCSISLCWRCYYLLLLTCAQVTFLRPSFLPAVVVGAAAVALRSVPSVPRAEPPVVLFTGLFTGRRGTTRVQ